MNSVNGLATQGVIGGGTTVYTHPTPQVTQHQPQLPAALNRAQKNIGAAKKGSANPFFKSSYADLGSVMEACKEALNNEGISVLQPVGRDSLGDFVETILLHTSGERISGKMYLTAVKNMQELGSAISYARRYGLQSLAFIPAADDDSESTMQRTSKPAPKPVKTKAPVKEQPVKQEPVKEEATKKVQVTEEEW